MYGPKQIPTFSTADTSTHQKNKAKRNRKTSYTYGFQSEKYIKSIKDYNILIIRLLRAAAQNRGFATVMDSNKPGVYGTIPSMSV